MHFRGKSANPKHAATCVVPETTDALWQSVFHRIQKGNTPPVPHATVAKKTKCPLIYHTRHRLIYPDKKNAVYQKFDEILLYIYRGTGNQSR